MNENNTQEPLTPNGYDFSQEQSKTSFFQKQISIVILIIVAAAAVLLIGALGVILGLQINKTNTFEKQAGTYKATLMSTEEGKKELEAANDQLNNQNKDLDQKASDANQKAADADKQAADASQQAVDANQKAADASQQAVDAKSKQATAEQSAADAKKKLDAANKELQDKLNEVQKVTNDLNAKKADLDKANRGIAKFGDLENLFNQYDNDAGEFTKALNNAYKAILDQDRSTYDYNISQMKKYSQDLNTVYNKIIALFDDIKNNNY